LTEEDIEFLFTDHDHLDYPTFIQDEFEGLYFTDEENEWLDRMYVNINELDNKYKRAIAFSAIAQSCLAKRPYNLFHRANLYMRTEEVERSFGNKTTWEKSFEEHFRENVEEYNNAVFDNGQDNKAFNRDVMEWEDAPDADLVYLDPPYYDRTKQNGKTDYQFYYHFLEGYLQYEDWGDMIDDSVKTKRLEHEPSPWTDPDRIYDAFEYVFDKFADKKIVLSYNSAGLPEPEELKEMLEERKENVVAEAKEHQYALSTHEDSADELVFVAYD
jgi:adenine-specific DNA methylase